MLIRIARTLAVPREPMTRTVSPGFSFTLLVPLDIDGNAEGFYTLELNGELTPYPGT
jgi:hypothetical protein